MNKIIKISTTLFFITLLTIGTNAFATLQNDIGIVAGSAGNKIKEYRKNREQALLELVSPVQYRMNQIRGDLLNPKITDESIAEIKAEFEELRAEFADILLVAEVKNDLREEILRINGIANKLVLDTREGDDKTLSERAAVVQSSLSKLSQDTAGFGTIEDLSDAKAQLDEHIGEVLNIQTLLKTGGAASGS